MVYDWKPTPEEEAQMARIEADNERYRRLLEEYEFGEAAFRFWLGDDVPSPPKPLFRRFLDWLSR